MRPKKSFNLKSFPIIIGIITNRSATCGKIDFVLPFRQ